MGLLVCITIHTSMFHGSWRCAFELPQLASFAPRCAFELPQLSAFGDENSSPDFITDMSQPMEWVDASNSTNVLVIAPKEVMGTTVYSFEGRFHQPVWEFWDKRENSWKELFPHTQKLLEQCYGDPSRTTTEDDIGL